METEDKKAYITYLSDSYEKVSKEFFKNNDFHTSKLKNSINLFTKESLEERIPKPKRLEVYALLSGISFEQSLKSKLSKIQIEINNIIKENLKYFVLPDNLGLEHCVFKWPNEDWNETKEKIIIELLKIYPFEPFLLEIIGIQIHSDGCIIAKGYDKSMRMKNIRRFLKENLDFYPNRQSEWSHIPLGRILEPIGSKKYEALKVFAKRYKNLKITSTLVREYKFVFEKRWYMEEKEIIKSIGV